MTPHKRYSLQQSSRLAQPSGPSHEGGSSCLVFIYRLFLENGEDIGSFAAAVPDWSIGDEFFSGDHTRFRILNILPGEDFGSNEFSGAFVVTPSELAEPT